ncbi:MAG: ABC transporter permease, partial [Reyranella sp.]
MAVITEDLAPPARRFSLWTAIRRNPTIAFGAVLLTLLILVAVVGPSFVGDPFKLSPRDRLRPPSERWWFGTDQFGRDVFTRTVWGARVSLEVGLSVAAISSILGLALGLACGY